MKHKTSELTGALLDQAVAKACGYLYNLDRMEPPITFCLDTGQLSPSQVPAVCEIVVDDTGQPRTAADAWARGSAPGYNAQNFAPSTNWAHGGPIIEQHVAVVQSLDGGTWEAAMPVLAWPRQFDGWLTPRIVGPTPLVAAMRAFVAAKLGDEVEL